MNTLMMQMRHTAHELRVTLDHVIQGGEAAAAAQTSQDENVSFLAESGAEMTEELDIPQVSALIPRLLTTRLWEGCSIHLHAPSCPLPLTVCFPSLPSAFLFYPTGRSKLFVPLGASSSTEKSLHAHRRVCRLQEVHVSPADDTFRQRDAGHALSAGPKEHLHRGGLPQASAPS